MISIVVVTYNRLEYTKQCIESILRGTDIPAELIVIDNASQDGTVEYLYDLKIREGSQIVEIHRGYFARNEGCPAAYNKGFQMARGDPIFRIDNDVIVPAGWAFEFMRLWGSDPELGMMTTDIELETWKHPEKVRVSPPYRVAYFEGSVWHDHGLGSWCMAHRRAMFERIGYYRDHFGLFALCDNDLERRAQEAGWRLGTASGITVGHLWRHEEPDEVEYNNWKIHEYHEQIKVWERIWGGQESAAGSQQELQEA